MYEEYIEQLKGAQAQIESLSELSSIAFKQYCETGDERHYYASKRAHEAVEELKDFCQRYITYFE